MTRRLTLVVLAFLLVLTTQSMAVVRAAPDASGQIVLCTGGGVVTVFLDENGNPVGPPHVCPDCLAQLLDVDLAQISEPMVVVSRWGHFVPVPHAVSDLLQETGYRSRGPPSPIGLTL